MERLFYQQEWQGIALRPLTPKGAGIAGRDLYAAFYQRTLAGEGLRSPEWRAAKRRLGGWLVEAFLVPRGTPSALRVLSIGAGLGIVEEVLWERGYRVDVIECQAHSLQDLQGRLPGALSVVGDARQLPYRSSAYDLVYLSTVDYCFACEEYIRVLGEMGRVLRAGGRAVSICTSNLSVVDLVRMAVRDMMRPARGRSDHDEQVPWGYLRTVGEHLQVGGQAGLLCEAIYLFDRQVNLRAVRFAHSFRAAWPTWGDANVAVVFKTNGAQG